MEIILLRHGRPKVDLHAMLKNRYSSADLENLVHSYNLAGLSDDNKIPENVIEIVSACNIVVHSDLPRSIDSVKALYLNELPHYSHAIFREAELPFANWKQPKLTLFTWLVLFRALWYLGYSKNAESLSSAKKRAACAAKKLIMFSEKHDSVIFVGHGFMNRFIAKELLANGWEGPKVPGDNYWEYGVYQKS